MKLKEYMDKYMVVQKHFAAKAGVYPPTINKLISEKSQPSLKVALRIQELTEGKVTVYDWGKEEAMDNKKVAKTTLEKTITIKKKKKIRNS